MSETNSADLNIRRYLIVFGCMIAGALLTVGVSLAPLGNHKLNIALALVTIALQAFLVLGFMMHLLSERHTILAVLGFTGFFLVFLMFLTIWSVSEVPDQARPSAPPVAAAQPAH
jgi:heme/copper-type cytochrome/quinol oxidase subunit 4